MELPAWYRRLLSLSIKEDREIESEDFDEDISELREGEGDSDYDYQDLVCQSENEDECECYPMDDGAESQRSYTGSDADFYYELKDDRISRKKELLEERKRHQKERTLIRELESGKEQEVYAAYDAMLESQKKGDRPRPRLESIAGKHVDFYFISDNGEIGDAPDRKIKIEGQMYFNSRLDCDLEPFRQPKRAERKKRRLKVRGSETELVFQFISDKYLTMTVRADWEMIEKDVRKSEAAEMPNVFKFVGIHMDLEERKPTDELWRQFRHNVRPSPPSPRESFFERTHPMGAWNTEWW